MTYYGKIFEWMGKIVDAIKEKIGNLELKAIELGKDMLKGFIDGIKVKTGKLGDSVKSISEKIKNFLYFSKPDLGPLRDYETWMQDMIKGMAESIKGSTHLLEKATDQMANKIANGLSFSSIVDNTTKAMKSLGYDVRTSLNPMNNQNANSLLLENQNINSNDIISDDRNEGFTAIINNNSKYPSPWGNVRLLRQEYKLYRLKYGGKR